MTDYTDPESPAADPHAEETHRMMYTPPYPACILCGLVKREHINDRFCPEWRLRQLDGDR